MKVVVIGGSNSILSGGWTSQLQKRLTDVPVKNLSVGNSCSIMGYFQILHGADLQPGDVVIWEYALNDEEQADGGEVRIETSLRYIEMTILKILQDGASFIPLIFEARDRARLGRFSLYKLGLRELLRRYQTPSIDITRLYCERHGGSRVAPDEYLHRVHYRIESSAIAIAVESCISAIQSAAPPQKPRSPCLDPNADRVFFLRNFRGGRSFRFINSLVDLQTYQPMPQNELVGILPEGTWRLAGAIMLRNSGNGRIAIMVKETQIETRTYHVIKTFEKPLVGMVHFSNKPPLIVDDSDSLRIASASPVAQRPFSSSGPTSADHGVIALHFERV